MSFEKLAIHPSLLKAVAESGYSTPTLIQQKAIPEVLKGSDLQASAQTGTGKTAAFLLPALHKIISTKKKIRNGPRVLVLVPTRELGMQIATQAEKYSKYLPQIKTVSIGGGVSLHIQMRKLSKPYDLLIATPGRLIDFINRKKIDLGSVEMLVLDEADRMLDMGFYEQVEEIAITTPPTRQTLLFSATMQGSVMELSKELLNHPVEIYVNPEQPKHENISQNIHYVDDLNHKNRLLDHFLADEAIGHAIIFTSTKRHADELVHELRDKGHLAGALHGDMNQRQRTRTIQQLRDGKIKILVATDVAARGIDVQSITHVINFDLPNNIEDYVHRVGRTGRAGLKGHALSFVRHNDISLVKRIEQFLKHKIDVIEVKGLEAKKSAKKQGFSSHKRNNRFSKKSNRSFNTFSRKHKSQTRRPRAKRKAV